jgi:hypothetical protein
METPKLQDTDLTRKIATFVVGAAPNRPSANVRDFTKRVIVDTVT